MPASKRVPYGLYCVVACALFVTLIAVQWLGGERVGLKDGAGWDGAMYVQFIQDLDAGRFVYSARGQRLLSLCSA